MIPRTPSQAQLRRAEATWGPRPKAAPRSTDFVASDWRAINRNTLKGFFTLALPSGLALRECSYHEQGAKRWVGLPGRPLLDADGRHRIDPATGKKAYVAIVEIAKSAREKFQKAAVDAVDKLLGTEAAP
jgi:hypothetical protein